MWSRRQVLGGLGASALLAPASALAYAPVAPKRLWVNLVYGGWDTAWSIDPKPDSDTLDAPSGVVRDVNGIPVLTDPSRPAIESFFERWGDATAVIRGIETGSIAHVICYRKLATGTGQEGSADIAARVAEAHGITRPLPYLVLGFRGYAGPLDALAGRIGSRNQLAGLLDPSVAYEPTLPGTGFRPEPSEAEHVRRWIDARVARERALRGQVADNRRALDDFTASLDRAERLTASASILAGADPSQRFRERASIALDAFAMGLSQTALVEVGVDFDTHRTNGVQGALQQGLFSDLDFILTELDALPGEAAGTTMLDETLVLTMSEMTRTPVTNGMDGKDHWPWATVMVHGRHFVGGRVHGVTDDAQRGLPIDLTTGDAAAGGRILDPATFLSTVQALTGMTPDGAVLESVLL